MIVICQHCREEIEVDRSALYKKVRCPLCGQTTVARAPKAEVVQDDSGSVDLTPLESAAPPPGPAAPLHVEEDDTGDGLIPLADDDNLEPFSDDRHTAPEDPLAALTEFTGHPVGRRGRRADARAALDEFRTAGAAGPTEPVQWPGADGRGTDANALGDLADSSESPPSKAKPKPVRKTRSTDWFVVSEECEYGPFTPQEIAAMIRGRKIAPGILVRPAFGGQAITIAQLARALPKEFQPKARKPRPKPRPKGGKADARPAPPAPTPSTDDEEKALGDALAALARSASKGADEAAPGGDQADTKP